MKLSNQRNFSILAALIIAMLVVTVSLLSEFMNESEVWKLIIIEGLLVFILSYLIIFYFVKKIVLQKITPLYKIIHQATSPSDEIIDINEGSDLVDTAGKDVADWARLKTKEIDKLKRLEKYRKEFLGNVSHELKTPIFNIQGYVSTLLDGGLEDDKINRKYLERAEQSINRMISIVEDLEAISKLESGELQIQRTDFNIQQLLSEVCEMHEIRASHKKIKIQIIQSNESFIVNADRTRIADVVSNLVLNSIIYGKECGKTTLQLFDMDDKVLVEVSDNGIGIEEKYLTRLFERFFRVDKSRSSEMGGTGLGLAIVKHILEVHSQPIYVKSKIGEGTSFTFTLEKSKKTK